MDVVTADKNTIGAGRANDHKKLVNDHSERMKQSVEMSKNIYYCSIVQNNTMITKSYFCFECGAILTTKEDKKQHEEWELHKKTTAPIDEP